MLRNVSDARNQLSNAETFALVSEIILFTGTSTLSFHVDITLTHFFSKEGVIFSLSLNINKLETLFNCLNFNKLEPLR